MREHRIGVPGEMGPMERSVGAKLVNPWDILAERFVHYRRAGLPWNRTTPEGIDCLKVLVSLVYMTVFAGIIMLMI